MQPEEEGHGEVAASTSLAGAIKTIVLADAVMSLDNVIAVAGAANGSLALVVFGILISIPIVVWGSQFVLKMMDRFPAVITAGGALLGWVGGGMVVGDPALPPDLFAAIPHAKYLASLLGAALVLIVGRLLATRVRALHAGRLGEDLVEQVSETA
jgi:predicted tellurium resistance membrane protein TerC